MANSVTRQLLLQEAAKRGWEVQTIGPRAQLCKITTPDGETETFSGSRPMKSSANGRHIAVYKDLTLSFVQSLGYDVPPYATVDNFEAALPFLEQYGTVVVKPIDGSQSVGVSVGIETHEKLYAAMSLAKNNSASGRVIIQKQIKGKLYRILVINGKVPVVTERRAARVIGDGVSSVSQLVELLNQDPRRGHGSDTPLKVVEHKAVEAYLGSPAMQHIPARGEIIRVSDIESVSAGGEAANLTDIVDQTWVAAACAITKAMGLFIAGFDIMTENIAQPIEGKYIPLLEVNSSPGLKIHEYPSQGEPVHIAPLLFNELFSTES